MVDELQRLLLGNWVTKEIDPKRPHVQKSSLWRSSWVDFVTAVGTSNTWLECTIARLEHPAAGANLWIRHSASYCPKKHSEKGPGGVWLRWQLWDTWHSYVTCCCGKCCYIINKMYTLYINMYILNMISSLVICHVEAEASALCQLTTKATKATGE